MTRAFRIARLAAALAIAAAGCAQDQTGRDRHAGHDHRPKPEGRIEVDQSAVLPVDVKAGVQREYPGAAVVGVNKRTYDDRAIRYEVQVRTKDGKDATRVFDADGKPYTAGSEAGTGSGGAGAAN